MKSRILTQSILCVMTCIITLFSASFAQAQEKNWQDAGCYDTGWYDNHKDNTEYEIATAKELAGLAKLVNGGISFEGETIKLTATEPIDLGDRYWIPIGNTTDERFQGFLDGNGNTIAGLRIDHSKSDAGTVYSGLFGHIYSSKENFIAGVKDLTLAGGEVKGGGTGNSYTGALAGLVKAGYSGGPDAIIAITGITSTVVVSGPAGGTLSCTGGLVGEGYGTGSGTVTLSGCINSGPVTGGKVSYNSHTGGIIGYGYGAGSAGGSAGVTLSGCVNTGSVTGGEATGSHTGGFIGYGFGGGSGINGAGGSVTLSDSYNTGDVIVSKGYAGGIAGYMVTSAGGTVTGTATILNCLSAGSVNNSDASVGGAAATGGIVGALQQGNAGADIITVKNCFAIPASLTGEPGVPLRRIAGKIIDNTPTLRDNYARTSFGNWTETGHDNLDGEDWILPATQGGALR